MVGALLAVAEEASRASGNWATQHAWLIPVMPFVAFFAIVFFGKRLPRKGSEIGILAIGASFALALVILVGDYVGGGGPIIEKQLHWLPFGNNLSLGLGMKIDGLAAVMFVVVTLVSLMVHIYSTAYMRGDKRYTWYYAALALFVIAVAAAEVGIGLAIVLTIFRNRETINLDEVDLLKW